MNLPFPSPRHAITPRDRRFGRGAAIGRWWNGGDPYASALYNALSATFPKGEKFFVDSVRAFRAGMPPKLDAQVAAFVRQEAAHSREHAAFNRRVREAGYDISPLEARVDWRLSIVADKRPIVALAATMALEHFTAILAHELLADPRHLAGADAETAALWRWHAVEEIEHKAVAYDSWLHATRRWPRFKRWLVKARVMQIVTRNFIVDRSLGALELLRQDGIAGPRAWWGLFRAAFVRPGMFRKVAGAWAGYFMPRFHPWRRDDRHLIAAAQGV
ncbi:MAG: metal-dependent hydrolase [Sphingomonadaceae bacterium]